MLRRQFLKIALLPAVKAAPRSKITGVRIVPLKTIREVGRMEPAWNPGTPATYRVGGGAFSEIQTDQGVTGIGPGMNAEAVEGIKELLVGQDPFDIERIAPRLRYYAGRDMRAISCAEIALWDLIGKAAQQPLYKLWGAEKDRVPRTRA
jgi:L-alanine-DL-glutamate epimerase-like enolase superfamily enzyme